MTRKCLGCGKAGHRLESCTSRAALEIKRLRAKLEKTRYKPGSRHNPGRQCRKKGYTKEDSHSVACRLRPTPMHKLHFHSCSHWHERYCPAPPHIIPSPTDVGGYRGHITSHMIQVCPDTWYNHKMVIVNGMKCILISRMRGYLFFRQNQSFAAHQKSS